MNKQILRLALPNILSNISVPLLGLADTIVMGHIKPEPILYIGAVGLGGMAFNVIIWTFGFLRMAVTGMTAQSYGRRDGDESLRILQRALALGLGLCLLLILLKPLFIAGIFQWVHGSSEVEALAETYVQIRFWGLPASFSLMAIHGWFLGMQNARIPMWLTIVTNVLNILLNMVMVFGLGMKSEGVALATVSAQYVGLGLGLWALHRFYNKKARLRHMASHDKGFFSALFDIQALQPSWQSFKPFLQVSGDIFIRSFCLTFALLFFMAKSAESGDEILAVNQILEQFLMITSFGVDGFAYAAESLIGRFTGSGERKKMRQALVYLFVWGCGLGLTLGLIYLLLGPQLLHLFSSDQGLIRQTLDYLWWMPLLSAVSAPAFMWDGAYIGATATRPMRNIMMIATFGVFLPCYYLSQDPLGNHGLWLAMLAFMLSRSILMSLWAKKALRYVK